MLMTVSHVSLDVRRLPEGVYLATSADVPGLTVEADTREEAEAAARTVAIELIEEELGHPLARRPDFTVTYL
jgi:predicted RNase H-like HicB family nuclease